MSKILYQNHDLIIIIHKLTLQKSFIIFLLLLKLQLLYNSNKDKFYQILNINN